MEGVIVLIHLLLLMGRRKRISSQSFAQKYSTCDWRVWIIASMSWSGTGGFESQRVR
jgi:hypothetical protein